MGGNGGGRHAGAVTGWTMFGVLGPSAVNGAATQDCPVTRVTSSVSAGASAVGATSVRVCGPAAVTTRPTYCRVDPASNCRNIPDSSGTEGNFCGFWMSRLLGTAKAMRWPTGMADGTSPLTVYIHSEYADDGIGLFP
jgi:hypothetical protein